MVKEFIVLNSIVTFIHQNPGCILFIPFYPTLKKPTWVAPSITLNVWCNPMNTVYGWIHPSHQKPGWMIHASNQKRGLINPTRPMMGWKGTDTMARWHSGFNSGVFPLKVCVYLQQANGGENRTASRVLSLGNLNVVD